MPQDDKVCTRCVMDSTDPAVTFDEAGITEIQIPEHSETQIISDPAFERVPANIIEYQSLQMATVTGATISQFAIISAVADAIAQWTADHQL